MRAVRQELVARAADSHIICGGSAQNPVSRQYKIVRLHHAQLLGPESMGSKAKFWCKLERSQPSSSDRWMFKYPQANTGQHWAEKIASELAACLGTPHAAVRLATYNGYCGSICRSFVSATGELLHGNELLRARIAGYDPRKRFRQADHTLDNIWHVLDRLSPMSPQLEHAKCHFAKYLVLAGVYSNGRFVRR